MAEPRPKPITVEYVAPEDYEGIGDPQPFVVVGEAPSGGESGPIAISGVTGLQDALDGKANASDIPDVSGFITESQFQDALAGKANKVNQGQASMLEEGTDTAGRPWAAKDIADYVQAASEGKADKSEIPDVSGFLTASQVQDLIDAALAGSGEAA